MHCIEFAQSVHYSDISTNYIFWGKKNKKNSLASISANYKVQVVGFGEQQHGQ